MQPHTMEKFSVQPRILMFGHWAGFGKVGQAGDFPELLFIQSLSSGDQFIYYRSSISVYIYLSQASLYLLSFVYFDVHQSPSILSIYISVDIYISIFI